MFFYPMNRFIFQPDGSRMYPIFHCSIIPIVSEANSLVIRPVHFVQRLSLVFHFIKSSIIRHLFSIIFQLFLPQIAENADRNVSRQIRYRHLRFLEVIRKTAAAAGNH